MEVLAQHKTTTGGFVKLALIMLASLAVASLLLDIGIFGGDSNIAGNAAPFESDGEEATGMTDGVIDVPGFTFDVEGVTPMGSNDRVPWSGITGCRVEGKIEGRGKLRQVTTYVVLSTATQNLRTVMNSMSDREACVGVCRAISGAMDGASPTRATKFRCSDPSDDGGVSRF